jgi:DNA-binding MarR family transcriptional regulator
MRADKRQDVVSDPSSLAEEYRRYLAAVVAFHLAAADTVGLGATDYQALNILDLEGPLNGGELAQRLGLTTGATTRLLDRLEKAGVARRVTDPGDRRRLVIETTGRLPDGLAEILGRVRGPIGTVVQQLDAHQLEGLQTYLRGSTEAYRAATAGLTDGR